MGVIYPSDKVFNGQLPEEGAHAVAGDQLLVECVDWAESDPEDGPVAWMLYGSVPDKRMNRRSDVDFLIIYNSANEQASLNKLLAIITEVEYKHHVVVEPNYHHAADAVAGRHHIDAFFLELLLEAQNRAGFSFGLPASKFNVDEMAIMSGDEARQKLLGYTVAKRSKFFAALHGGVFDPHRLQRAFELPKKLAWKLSRVSEFEDEIEFTNPAELPDGAWLIEQDREYTALLDLAADHQVTPEHYNGWLNQIYKESLRRAMCLSIGVIAMLDSKEVSQHTD